MKMERDYKKIVRMSMRGAAEHWFDLIEDQCENLEDFENKFLNYYWGDEAQSRVRENLYNGRFDDTRGTSREQYAMRKINKVRYLEPQMTDGDIIKYVARHFTQEIKDVIAIQGIQDVDRLLTYLRRVDDIKPCVNKQVRYKNNNIWRDSGRACDNISQERRPYYRNGGNGNLWSDGGRACNNKNKQESKRYYDKRSSDSKKKNEECKKRYPQTTPTRTETQSAPRRYEQEQTRKDITCRIDNENQEQNRNRQQDGRTYRNNNIQLVEEVMVHENENMARRNGIDYNEIRTASTLARNQQDFC